MTVFEFIANNSDFFISAVVVISCFVVLREVVDFLSKHNYSKTLDQVLNINNQNNCDSKSPKDTASTDKHFKFNFKRKSKDDKDTNSLGLMKLNLKQIRGYYEWSKKQAKRSFNLACTMCILGFILISLSIILPIHYDLSLETSIITAIGGVVTELIAGTAIAVYRSSLSQFNYYHRSLHEDARFLSSINLSDELSNTELKDTMLQEIIRSEMQMNVLEISNSNLEEKAKKKSENK